MMDVIRNPESTKKTSTPVNPPRSAEDEIWKINTAKMAIALIPSNGGE
jgi:hypothetical protein